jgi:hypothetical protein
VVFFIKQRILCTGRNSSKPASFSFKDMVAWFQLFTLV